MGDLYTYFKKPVSSQEERNKTLEVCLEKVVTSINRVAKWATLVLFTSSTTSALLGLQLEKAHSEPLTISLTFYFEFTTIVSLFSFCYESYERGFIIN